MKAKALIFFQVYDTKLQYDELFPYSEIENIYQIVEAGAFNKEDNKITLSIRLNFITKKLHALLHNCMLMQRRYSTLMYLNRVRGYFPNRFEFKTIKFRNFKKRSFIDRLVIVSFSNLAGIIFLKLILRFFFRLENFSQTKKLLDFSLFILPYTGGISAEWDFLVWYSRRNRIESVAIQENWDNLSSKQFLLEHPLRFYVWGKQSGSHLRTFQNFTGEIVEVGCLRVQDFYNVRNEYIEGNLIRSNSNYILYVDSNVERGDHYFLTLLSNFLAATSNINLKDTFILYRTHPKAMNDLNRSNYLDELKSIPLVQIHQPNLYETNKERLEQVVEAKAVISIFSTMLLESLIAFKKCIVPNFNIGFENYSQKSIIDDLTHFHGISMLSNIEAVTNPTELFDQLNELDIINIDTTCESKIFDWFCKNTNTKTKIVENLNKIYNNL